MERDHQFCEKHPKERVAYCSFCLREVRIAIRQECIDLQGKMDAYRELIVGPEKKEDERP